MTEETMDLREFIGVLLRRWWLIFLFTILAVVVSLIFSLATPPGSPAPAPYYEASSVVHLEGAADLVWLPELAKSRPVLSDTITDLNLSFGVENLAPKVSATRVEASNMVRITVGDSDLAMAAAISNGVAQNYIDYISAVRGSPFVATRQGRSNLDPGSVDVPIALDPNDPGYLRPYIISAAETRVGAVPTEAATAPGANIYRNLVLALFLGVLLSVVLIIAREYIQNPISSPAQFDRKFGLTRLGILPRWRKRRNQAYPLPIIEQPTPGMADAIRQIATSLVGAMGEPPIRSLAMVSPTTRDGRSSATANLGIALAGSWKTVILLDADLRSPSLHRYFGVDNEVGLSSFLDDPNLEVTQIIQETSYQRLKIVPSGPKPINPVELLSSPRMQWLTDYLKENFEVVLVDTPPLLAATDGVVVSSRVEGAVLLVNCLNCRADSLRTAVSYLEEVGASILGYLWNGKDPGPAGGHSRSVRYHRRIQHQALAKTTPEATSLPAELPSRANGTEIRQTTHQQ